MRIPILIVAPQIGALHDLVDFERLLTECAQDFIAIIQQ